MLFHGGPRRNDRVEVVYKAGLQRDWEIRHHVINAMLPPQEVRQDMAYALRNPLCHRDLFLRQSPSLRLEVLDQTLGHIFRDQLNICIELLQHLDDDLVRVCVCYSEEPLHGKQLGRTLCNCRPERSQLRFVKLLVLGGLGLEDSELVAHGGELA